MLNADVTRSHHSTGVAAMDDRSAELAVLLACFREMAIGTRQLISAATSCANMPARDSELIQKSTRYIKDNLTGIRHETIVDWLSVNDKPHDIRTILELNDQFVVIDEDEARSVACRDSKSVRDAWPDSNGVLDCSRVGFNRDKTQALVYAGVHLGFLNGHGTLRLFSLSDDGWVQNAKARAWVS